jgi:tetratricopeptide (TPR) repeat protein
MMATAQRATVHQPTFSKIAVVTTVLLSIAGCRLSFTNIEYRKGQKAAEKQNYASAVEHFKKVMLRAPESSEAIASAREAARISLFETKKFSDAVMFYEHLVRFSSQERERREAQQKIADIYFEKLTDYARAIEEFNKLLLIRAAGPEEAEYRYKLAKAHFYLNRFDEAQNEIDRAIKIADAPEKKYDLQMFLASIFFNTKRIEQAIEIYNGLTKDYPDRAKSENIAMNIVVCYEELEAFDKAIDKLEKMRPTYADPEFIDLKIKRLRERRANLPGSRGLRK